MAKLTTPPILIGDLPSADVDARKVFAEIQNNTYENKSLGKQKQAEDPLPCDCNADLSLGGLSPSAVSRGRTYDLPFQIEGVQGPHRACGEYADCINRLTQTECMESECRAKSYCQNQRCDHTVSRIAECQRIARYLWSRGCV